MTGHRNGAGPGVAQGDRAGFGERVAAAMIDLGIMLLASAAGALAGYAVSGAGDWGFAAGIAIAVAAVTAATWVLVPAFMARPGARNGQSPGKQALDIRVVRESGAPTTFWSAFLREVVVKQWIGIWATTGLFALVDCLWPLFDDESRAVHDSIANTRVVRATRPGP